MPGLAKGAIKHNPSNGPLQVFASQRRFPLPITCAYINIRRRGGSLRNTFLRKGQNFRTRLTQCGHSSTRREPAKCTSINPTEPLDTPTTINSAQEECPATRRAFHFAPEIRSQNQPARAEIREVRNLSLIHISEPTRQAEIS